MPPADQGTADDGPRPEYACGPPVADGEPVHGGADDGSAAVVGQVVVGGGGDEGADQGDAERRAELLGLLSAPAVPASRGSTPCCPTSGGPIQYRCLVQT